MASSSSALCSLARKARLVEGLSHVPVLIGRVVVDGLVEVLEGVREDPHLLAQLPADVVERSLVGGAECRPLDPLTFRQDTSRLVPLGIDRLEGSGVLAVFKLQVPSQLLVTESEFGLDLRVDSRCLGLGRPLSGVVPESHRLGVVQRLHTAQFPDPDVVVGVRLGDGLSTEGALTLFLVAVLLDLLGALALVVLLEEGLLASRLGRDTLRLALDAPVDLVGQVVPALAPGRQL